MTRSLEVRYIPGYNEYGLTLSLFSSGYLYFHAAPDAPSFHQECVRRVKNLHTADCLRANKSVFHG